MTRVFLSYAREDAGEAADNLRTKLSLAGHIVWRDIEDMRGGLSWKDQIRRQIEAVHCVVVLLTPRGVASANVEHEWRSAFELGKRVIPLLIQPCDDIPPELSRLHYHPATDLESYERMLMVLVRDLADLDKQISTEQRPTEDVPPELIAYVQEAVKAYSQRLEDLLRMATERPPLEPYKELYAFELTDGQIFFGRETDAKRLQRIVLRDRIAVLHARSGAGKTSVVNAGLMPLLITAGYVPVYARAHTDPVEAVKRVVTAALPQKPPAALQRLSLHHFLRIAETALGTQSREIVIILDQFEEFFVLYPEFKQRQPFIDAIADCYEDLTLRARFLLSLRKDYFSDLDDFKERLPGIFINEFRLLNLTRQQAMDAIVEPVKTVDPSVSYDQDLLIELLNDLETSGMELPHLQIICSQLYTDRDETHPVISLVDYEQNGRARGILGNYLNKTLLAFPQDERRVADDVLFELVSSQSTKRILERVKLIAAARAPEAVVDRVLLKLVNARLLRRDKDSEEGQTLYEMAHEYLVDEIQRRNAADPTRIATKQIQESLGRAVIEWKTGGILMQRAQLERVYRERENLHTLTDDELMCVFLSCMKENFQVKYWLNRDVPRSLNLLKSVIESDRQDIALRRRAVVSLSYLGDAAVPYLAQLLKGDESLIQKRAEDVLERLDTLEARKVLQELHSRRQAQARDNQQPSHEDLHRVKTFLTMLPPQDEAQERKRREEERRQSFQQAAERRKRVEAERKKAEEEERRKSEAAIQPMFDRWVKAIESQKIGYPSSLRALASIDKDKSNQAVKEIARIGAPAVPILIEALRETYHFELRWAAIKALGLIQHPSAVPALLETLRDPEHWELRQDAAWALGRIGDEAANAGLTAALQDADRGVRETASTALWEIRQKKR